MAPGWPALANWFLRALALALLLTTVERTEKAPVVAEPGLICQAWNPLELSTLVRLLALALEAKAPHWTV
ncbi:hypothetical protein D3C87_1874820 [compost metagenome]